MVTCKKFQWNIVIWLINIKYFEKVVAEERCPLMISGCNQRFDCTCMSKYKHCLKLQCTCTQLISTRCCLQLYMHLLYLETEGTWVYLLWGTTCISNTKLQIVTEKCFQTTCTTKEVQCCRKWLREGPFFSFFALKKG